MVSACPATDRPEGYSCASAVTDNRGRRRHRQTRAMPAICDRSAHVRMLQADGQVDSDANGHRTTTTPDPPAPPSVPAPPPPPPPAYVAPVIALSRPDPPAPAPALPLASPPAAPGPPPPPPRRGSVFARAVPPSFPSPLPEAAPGAPVASPAPPPPPEAPAAPARLRAEPLPAAPPAPPPSATAPARPPMLESPPLVLSVFPAAARRATFRAVPGPEFVSNRSRRTRGSPTDATMLTVASWRRGSHRPPRSVPKTRASAPGNWLSPLRRSPQRCEPA